MNSISPEVPRLTRPSIAMKTNGRVVFYKPDGSYRFVVTLAMIEDHGKRAKVMRSMDPSFIKKLTVVHRGEEFATEVAPGIMSWISEDHSSSHKEIRIKFEMPEDIKFKHQATQKEWAEDFAL